MYDFIIINSNERKVAKKRYDYCEQLCFSNATNQTEIRCSCTQYYNLADDGRSCKPNCAYTSSAFRCSRSEKCIITNDLCNNITDCLHGEDEHDIVCGHFCE
ncbi:unnamed protein product [Adineta steineri]|uniref:Uncharacterized protein n=1 Tax=Adineta steineri TaxID=433720 RepID=A0A813U8K7_9BILA|nr:unnamed protein product [Adineta steineri]